MPPSKDFMTWKLEDLFPALDAPEVEQTLTWVDQKTTEFEGYREQLSDTLPVEDLLKIVQLLEEISLRVGKLFQYAYLKFSDNTQDSAASTFLARVEQVGAEITNRTVFFSLWWKALDDAAYARLIAGAGVYTYYLQTIRQFRPYTLSEAEEKVVNLKNVTGASALRSVYDAITNRFTFRIEVDGETRTLTQGELTQFVYSPKAELRAAAYQELFRVYAENGPVLGLIYQNYARDYYNEHVTLRGMASPIAHRNLTNDIPDEVVEKLLEATRKNAGVFQRFFRLKARWLGVDRIRRYDIYAPVSTEESKDYPFPKAVEMVREAFEGFDPGIAAKAMKVIEEEHIDTQVRPGKMSGAYNYGVDPAMTPYVLLNYNHKARDIAVLAHELGHSLHSLMAGHHNLFNSGSSLPLSETASTFGEMLLTEKLLAEENDPAVRRDILFAQIDDAFATILRQVYFALFEKRAHKAIVAGASVDGLCDIYYELLQEQFGDSLELSEDYRWEWTYISHFYDRPYYVYAYAFGQLLVLSLYNRYKQEGEAFIPRFLEILSSGSSKAPIDILDAAGVDVRTAEFWQGGFDVIAGIVDELEALAIPA